jgi:peptide deformylase
LVVVVTGGVQEGRDTSWQPGEWAGRILQHECDHLEGRMFIDRVSGSRVR